MFGALVAAVAKDEEPQASERLTGSLVDTATPDATPTPLVFHQWPTQAESIHVPKDLMPAREGLPTDQLAPVTSDEASSLSSQPDESVQHGLAAQSSTATSEGPSLAAARGDIRVRLSGPFESRSPSQLALVPAALSPSGIDGQSAQSDLAENATPRLASNEIPGRPTPDLATYANLAAINRATLQSRSDNASRSTETSNAAMTDEAAASDKPKAAPTAEDSKTPQHASSSPASQRAQDPLPQFAINAQSNAPTPSSDGMSVSPQPWNISTATAGSLEAPAKVALTSRTDAAVEMQTLALHIAARSARGDSRFTIRLDPPELGRIEVNLSMTSHGHAQAVLAVEKSQTLDLLLRDAPALERALKDAGLELGSNLSFSLKEEAHPQFTRDDDYAPRSRALELVPAEAASASSTLNAPLLEQLYGLRTARLDITV